MGVTKRNYHLTFDGFPFVANGEKIYWCHQGKDKHKADKAKNKDNFHLQVSKTTGVKMYRNMEL